MDSTELRTSNKKALLGYKARFQGENVIAIMKGKEHKECLGVISYEDLKHELDSGPYIELDNII